MTLLSRIARTAVALTRTALAPVRAALYVPVAHSTQSEADRAVAEQARAARLKALSAEGVDEAARARALNALDDIDAGLRQLAACLDPGSLPPVPGEDAEARGRRTFASVTAAARGAL